MSEHHFDAFAPRRCCGCGEIQTTVRNIAQLNLKAPVPGTGWGCFQCGLPLDGALALMCDDCAATPEVLIRWVVRGWLTSDERVPIAELDGSHRHQARFHPDMAQVN